MVLVSVVMASYNHEKYLPTAIESVLNQTFPDLELIIVDDCSKDNSKRVIERYQNQDPRVHAFFHEKNLGIARTANEGLNAVRGKFVSFIGSDDIWVCDKLEKQLVVLAGNEELVVWSEGEVINGDGRAVGMTFTGMHNASQKRKNGRIYQEIIDDNYIFGQSLLFKKDYCQNLCFNADLKYLSDYQFMVELAHEHDFVFMPEMLAKYRIHGSNSILKDKQNWLKDRVLLRTYFLERYSAGMSKHLRGNQYLKIGEAMLGLNQQTTAQHYFLKAMFADFFSKEFILYFTHAATSAKGVKHKLLLNLYLALNHLAPM